MDGFVRALIQTSGGFNEDGEPIPATTNFGVPVPCKYHANTLNNRGRYQDGEFTVSSYIITTKDMEFVAEQIQLTDNSCKVVCEKRVQSLEVLTTIKRVKITV